MASKPGLKERWNYWFDNFMARGTIALIGGLGLVSLLIIVVFGVIVTLGGPWLGPDGTESLPLTESIWFSLMRTLDAGTMGGDQGWGFRWTMLGVTLCGIFIISILIGIITAGVEGKIEEMRKGRSRVLESNHTVILGWSPQIFTIIPEIVIANENQKSSVITILADKDKVEMEEAVRDRVGSTGKTKVICRSGFPIDPADLEIISPHTARSIIILPPEEGDADSYIIKTALALTNSPSRRPEPYHIITQVNSEKTLNVVKMIGAKDEINAVLSGDLIARVTAQTSRQSGLSIVYTELLDFGGDEIYFTEEPTLSGKQFGDALSAYEDSTVMGLLQGGAVKINPPMDTRIAPGDQLIVIAADDDKIKLSGLSQSPIQSDLLRTSGIRAVGSPEKGLLLGWNHSAATIVAELDNYVAKGSSITVVADESFEEAVREVGELENQQIIFRAGDTTDRTLLHLRDISEKDSTPFSIVSEMLDLRNRELAEAARVDDFIVSDHLISLMLSQLSENGKLYDVFTDLFDPNGSEIYLKPVTDYVATGQPVNFYTVVEAARRRGETAIGYRIASQMRDHDKSYGVRTNPKKSQEITFATEDKLIVLAEN